MTDADAAAPAESDQTSARLRRHVTEAAVGLVIALVLLWTAIASATDVPFVYQGL